MAKQQSFSSGSRFRCPTFHSSAVRHGRRALVFLFLALTLVAQPTRSGYAIPPPGPRTSFPASDQAFLEDLERRSFQYFREQANSGTGLVLDRTRTDGSPADEDHRRVGSIAATGF